MSRDRLLALAIAAALLAPAHAHGPTRQKVTETITIDADLVQARLAMLASNADLSRFIL